MKLTCTLAALLLFSASADQSWVNVGEKNIATLLKLNEVAKEIKGKKITQTLMAKLMEKSMEHYAATMTCSMARGSDMAMHLTNVPATNCFSQMAHTWSMTRVLDYAISNFAIDPKSGGKTILEHMSFQALGVTDSGENVPGTSINADLNYRYHFNDQGLIEKMDQDFDSGILEDMQRKVMRFEKKAVVSEADLSLDPFAAAPWVTAGQKNIASVLRLSEIAKELSGKHITPAVMAKLSEDTMAFFAPTISCSIMQGSSKAMHLFNVPAKECMTTFAMRVANTKLIDYTMKRIAMDPESGGKTILTYEPFQAAGVTDTAQDVPGTRISAIMTLRYDFNDEGKIISYDQEMDSGIIDDMQKEVMTYQKKRVEDIHFDSKDTPEVAAIQLSAAMFFGATSLFLAIGCFSGAAVALRVSRHRQGPALLSEPY